jgi:hypothetical protein
MTVHHPRAGVFIQPEAWVVQYLVDHPEANRWQDQIAAYRLQMAGPDGDRIRQWLEALRTGAPWVVLTP